MYRSLEEEVKSIIEGTSRQNQDKMSKITFSLGKKVDDFYDNFQHGYGNNHYEDLIKQCSDILTDLKKIKALK